VADLSGEGQELYVLLELQDQRAAPPAGLSNIRVAAIEP
jgi:hypothetical protein